MKCAMLRIDLASPVVLSSTAATTGGHQTHLHIPGSVLFGLAASRFSDWDIKEKAFTLFRSGKMRFGWGYPLTTDGQCGFPMPRCLHENKTNSADIKNLAVEPKAFDGDQPKQKRTGFLTLSNQNIMPTTVYTLKSAQNPNTGAAQEAQLFGYQSLAAGQSFVSMLEADDDIKQDEFDAIIKLLCGKARIGRARSAEFSDDVHVHCIDSPSEAMTLIADDIKKGTGFPIWLISDLVLIDQNGAPNLAPDLAALGLGTGAIDWQRSFVWHRKLAPFNRKLGTREPERIAIGAGSVLWALPKNDLRAGTIEDVQDAGIGMFRELGYGRFSMNPEILRTKSPTPAQNNSIWEMPESGQNDALATNFTQRLEAKLQARKNLDDTVEFAEIEIAKIKLRAKPSASQWGRVLQASIASQDLSTLKLRLFGDDEEKKKIDQSICKDSDSEWRGILYQFKTFVDTLQKPEHAGIDYRVVMKCVCDAGVRAARGGDDK